MPVAWYLGGFIGPVTEHRLHYGITHEVKTSGEKSGANGVYNQALDAPNIGTFDSPQTYTYIVRALDDGEQVLSPPAFTEVSAGPAPPTVAWVTPPPASAPSGGQFTVEWELTNYVDPAVGNGVGWGISHLLGTACDQPGGNGVYTCTVDVPAVSAPGTLYYTAYAENPIEFAFATITPVEITVP